MAIKQLKQVYNIENDSKQIKMIQEASLDKRFSAGYKIEDELLFGSQRWINALHHGIIPKHIITGVVCRVFMSGHNDYPEFEIENEDGKTIWTRYGIDESYKVGKTVELIYVEQKYNRPTDVNGAISKCVIEINVSD